MSRHYDLKGHIKEERRLNNLQWQDCISQTNVHMIAKPLQCLTTHSMSADQADLLDEIGQRLESLLL